MSRAGDERTDLTDIYHLARPLTPSAKTALGFDDRRGADASARASLTLAPPPCYRGSEIIRNTERDSTIERRRNHEQRDGNRR